MRPGRRGGSAARPTRSLHARERARDDAAQFAAPATLAEHMCLQSGERRRNRPHGLLIRVTSSAASSHHMLQIGELQRELVVCALVNRFILRQQALHCGARQSREADPTHAALGPRHRPEPPYAAHARPAAVVAHHAARLTVAHGRVC